jgi:hypothetical protein
MKKFLGHLEFFCAGMTVAFFVSYLVSKIVCLEFATLVFFMTTVSIGWWYIILFVGDSTEEKPLKLSESFDDGEDWTGWEKGGSECPKCRSKDTEQLDASVDEMTAGKMHCKSCGFEGGTFLY